MKVLVTGGTGLVGSALKSISGDYENYTFFFLSSKDCDLTNYEKTLNLFERIRPKFVIHLAANVGGLFKNMNQKVQMYEVNTLINLNVLKCAHEVGVKKCVSCLSTCIFPDKTEYPIDETMLHNGAPHSSNDCYAYAKRMLEVHSKAYKEQYGDNFVCVIPTNIYGPVDNFSLEDGHVIPALIHKCYLAKESGEDFVVRGSGSPLRQFIYSTDLAKLMMWVLEKYEEDGSIILSVGEKDEVSIKDVALEIGRAFNYEDRIVFDTTFSDGQYKKTADNHKLMNLIGDFEFIGIEEGIKRSVEWFVENYEVCRK
jgi:GDP-L-fucose synthase